MLDLNFKSEPSRPEQESDGQRQRQDSRVGQVTSHHSFCQSEASFTLFWPIRSKSWSRLPVRGWLADREVSAALSESSSRTFHPCHAIRSHYRPRQQHFETLRDTWGHWPALCITRQTSSALSRLTQLGHCTLYNRADITHIKTDSMAPEDTSLSIMIHEATDLWLWTLAYLHWHESIAVSIKSQCQPVQCQQQLSMADA